MSILHSHGTSGAEFWVLLVFPPMAHSFWISLWTYLLLGLNTDLDVDAKERVSRKRLFWFVLGNLVVLIILVGCMTVIVRDLLSGEVPWPISLGND
jgi:hypothetical protein